METKDENLPANHFSETDLHNIWSEFTENVRTEDPVIYNAISGFKFSKKDEETILINYSSETARSEFEKIQNEFFNHLKHKVNNFKIKPEFKMDVTLKKEIITKRSVFEKMAEKNPILREMDDYFKFDFS